MKTTQTELLYGIGGPLAVVHSDPTDPAALPGDPLFDFVLVPVRHAPDGQADTDRSAQPHPSRRLTVVKLVQRGKSDAEGNSGPDRRLMAILVADVAGYCRLMHADEAATVTGLNTSKRVMIREIETHGGRVVDSPGDNLMATFVSVVAAVQCAVTLQQRLGEMNRDLPEAQRMDFRMGIHLGDVIRQGPRVYGDAVNIAARLQGIAEPGGIWISRAVHEQVEHKLPLSFQCLGEQHLKNIPRPMAAFQVVDSGQPDEAA